MYRKEYMKTNNLAVHGTEILKRVQKMEQKAPKDQCQKKLRLAKSLGTMSFVSVLFKQEEQEQGWANCLRQMV